ncbi:polyubiquitin-like [Aphis craccivora]|uniref:Polyubiquitin-like n=1 Tax=Aphis craccivora TaxID=307492 RepID=A0A6G0ZAZ1_APHCR|nr:polyubiquitin-like [Aphis craccivora]
MIQQPPHEKVRHVPFESGLNNSTRAAVCNRTIDRCLPGSCLPCDLEKKKPQPVDKDDCTNPNGCPDVIIEKIKPPSKELTSNYAIAHIPSNFPFMIQQPPHEQVRHVPFGSGLNNSTRAAVYNRTIDRCLPGSCLPCDLEKKKPQPVDKDDCTNPNGCPDVIIEKIKPPSKELTSVILFINRFIPFSCILFILKLSIHLTNQKITSNHKFYERNHIRILLIGFS